jgi:hypothetical protein
MCRSSGHWQHVADYWSGAHLEAAARPDLRRRGPAPRLCRQPRALLRPLRVRLVKLAPPRGARLRDPAVRRLRRGPERRAVLGLGRLGSARKVGLEVGPRARRRLARLPQLLVAPPLHAPLPRELFCWHPCIALVIDLTTFPFSAQAEHAQTA